MEEKDYSYLIERIGAHTIAKFEIVEEYVKSWAQKLLQTAGCKGLIFIDCMCNCGLYRDSNDQIVFGTPIRVAKVLREAAGQYPNKHIYLFLNDYDTEKIECLKTKLPNEKGNFHAKRLLKMEMNCLMSFHQQFIAGLATDIILLSSTILLMHQ